MSPAPGASLGPYHLLALIGEGGMGRVFKARDTRLDRLVAVKVSAEGFSDRFSREARAIAALDHPHICRLYDVGPDYLVMELLEGEPLHGPLPLAKAVLAANQILDALAAAHRKGIVHRDLKPANILSTRDGVKLLDFGLARREDAASRSDATVTVAITGRDQIVGTLQYMAPEQLQNSPTDARADLFAFGCVLYELLSGKRAFQGESAASIIGAILHREPEPLDIPPPLDRVIRRCLAKDPDQRFQTARDLQYNLALALESADPRPAPAPSRSRLPWLAVAALAATAALAIWSPWRSPTPPAPLLVMNEELPAGFEPAAPMFGSSALALSPDGARVAISLRGPDRRPRLFTRLLTDPAWTPIDGAEGGLCPFFSPDSAWIAFIADNRLKKIPVTGGIPVELAVQSNNGFRGGSWASGGVIYFSAITRGLRRVAASGGAVEEIGPADSVLRRAFWPQVLPGAKSILFTENAYFSIDSCNLHVLILATGEIRNVMQGGYSATYHQTAQGGRLVYMRETSIFAVPFDLGRLAVQGPPRLLAEGAASAYARGGELSLSETGLLAYVPGRAVRRNPAPISWLDRSGRTSPLYATPGVFSSPRLSPDGKRIAFTVQTPVSNDIWVKDLDRDTPTRLSFLPGRPDWPFWSPDSKSILFSGPSGDLYWVDADASAPPERIAENVRILQGLAAFTPDAKRLVFSAGGGADPSGGYHLATAALEGEKGHRKLGPVEPLNDSPFDERHPALSPDGKWLAYDSVESGGVEVYVRPFPGPGGKWRVSAGGGLRPIWVRNGRELLYHNPNAGRAMIVPYSTSGAEFHPARPEPWSNAPLQGNPVFGFYDLSPDGSRLAVVDLQDEAAPPKPPTAIRFLVNWPAK